MNGRDIYFKALNLLGYTDEQIFKNKAITIINQVYSDLWFCIKPDEEFKPLKNLSDNIEFEQRVLNDIMLYGVAAFFAQGESDGDSQALFMRIYNQKRAGLIKITSIIDAIPNPSI